ncbi:hypothetical protein Tco_1071620 [Tanacetum coccineum]
MSNLLMMISLNIHTVMMKEINPMGEIRHWCLHLKQLTDDSQTTLSLNIKLPNSEEEEYDIWAQGDGALPETRKGYGQFKTNVTLFSQLEAHGAEVSTEDANHKFLRSLPSAWSNLAMIMRTNPEIDNLSIDDLYSKCALFHKAKVALIRLSLVFLIALSSCTPSILHQYSEKEVFSCCFAMKLAIPLCQKQSEDLDLLHEDLEQIVM